MRWRSRISAAKLSRLSRFGLKTRTRASGRTAAMADTRARHAARIENAEAAGVLARHVAYTERRVGADAYLLEKAVVQEGAGAPRAEASG